MNWGGKILLGFLVVLASLLIILLGLNLVNDLFHLWPVTVTEVKACDKFEIYRDLLIILLTALGVVGYFAYRQIGSALERKATKIVEEREYLIFSTFYHRLSDVHFREYEDIDPCHKKRGNQFDRLLELTIEEAKRAIEYLEKVDKETQKGLINVWRVNLAYHYAVRGKEENKSSTLELVENNWREATKYIPNEEHNIRESRVWVVLTYSDDKDEKKKAKQELRDLMKWTRATDEWKKEMAEKYSKNFGVSLKLS